MDVKIAEEEFDRWLVAFKIEMTTPDTIEKLKEVEKEI